MTLDRGGAGEANAGGTDDRGGELHLSLRVLLSFIISLRGIHVWRSNQTVVLQDRLWVDRRHPSPQSRLARIGQSAGGVLDYSTAAASRPRSRGGGHHGDGGGNPRAADGAVALVPVRHPRLLLRGDVHGRLGVRGAPQLEVPGRDQRVGALHLRHLHPDRGAHVPAAAWPLPHAAALPHLHALDLPVGVRHRPAAAPVQRLPLGLLPVPVQLHGPDHGRVRAALVLRLLHRGAAGHSQHAPAALRREGRPERGPAERARRRRGGPGHLQRVPEG